MKEFTKALNWVLGLGTKTLVVASFAVALFIAIFNTQDAGHTAERFLIHFFSSTGLLLIALASQRWVVMKFGFTAPKGLGAYLVPALVCLIVVFSREPFDAKTTGDIVKSYVDFVSWGLGFVAGVWGLYRMGSYLSTLSRNLARTFGR